MKKRTYLASAVYYFVNKTVASAEIPANEAESVAAQAEEHRDLRYHVAVNDRDTLMVIPWEKVAYVRVSYRTEDADAPNDDICDGVRKKDGIKIVTLGEGSLITMDTDTETGEAYVTQHYVYDGQEYDVARALICEAEFPAELVESVIFNGEEVQKDGLTFHLCHGGVCDCPDVPYDDTYLEKNFSVSTEIDGNTVCGCVIVHAE